MQSGCCSFTFTSVGKWFVATFFEGRNVADQLWFPAASWRWSPIALWPLWWGTRWLQRDDMLWGWWKMNKIRVEHRKKNTSYGSTWMRQQKKQENLGKCQICVPKQYSNWYPGMSWGIATLISRIFQAWQGVDSCCLPVTEGGGNEAWSIKFSSVVNPFHKNAIGPSNHCHDLFMALALCFFWALAHWTPTHVWCSCGGGASCPTTFARTAWAETSCYRHFRTCSSSRESDMLFANWLAK